MRCRRVFWRAKARRSSNASSTPTAHGCRAAAASYPPAAPQFCPLWRTTKRASFHRPRASGYPNQAYGNKPFIAVGAGAESVSRCFVEFSTSRIHPPRKRYPQHIVISMFARRPEVGFAHKEKLSYEQRCYESTRVREKYSDRFPVIVERDGNSDVPAVDKCAVTARYPRWPHAIHMLSTLPTRSPSPQVQVLDPARHDDGPAGVRAAQADRRACGAGDLRVCREHATTGDRAGQQRGACRPRPRPLVGTV